MKKNLTLPIMLFVLMTSNHAFSHAGTSSTVHAAISGFLAQVAVDEIITRIEVEDSFGIALSLACVASNAHGIYLDMYHKDSSRSLIGTKPPITLAKQWCVGHGVAILSSIVMASIMAYEEKKIPTAYWVASAILSSHNLYHTISE